MPKGRCITRSALSALWYFKNVWHNLTYVLYVYIEKYSETHGNIKPGMDSEAIYFETSGCQSALINKNITFPLGASENVYISKQFIHLSIVSSWSKNCWYIYSCTSIYLYIYIWRYFTNCLILRIKGSCGFSKEFFVDLS